MICLGHEKFSVKSALWGKEWSEKNPESYNGNLAFVLETIGSCNTQANVAGLKYLTQATDHGMRFILALGLEVHVQDGVAPLIGHLVKVAKCLQRRDHPASQEAENQPLGLTQAFVATCLVKVTFQRHTPKDLKTSQEGGLASKHHNWIPHC